jgi:hypothetical protein
VCSEGYPLHDSEVLTSLDAPVYVERVALGNNNMIQGAAKEVPRALEAQVKGLGFSLIEILSPCPTIWKMQPADAQKWVAEELTKVYPLGVFRDRTKEAAPRPVPAAAPSLEEVARIAGMGKRQTTKGDGLPHKNDGLRHCEGARQITKNDGLPHCGSLDARIKVAGFGGTGGSDAGPSAGGSGIGCGARSVLASVLWAGDAIGHFELPCAALESADRFASGLPSDDSPGAE